MSTWAVTLPSSKNQNPNVVGLGGLRRITVTDIQFVKPLELHPANNPQAGWSDSRPAFRIVFRDGSSLVVKGELNDDRGNEGNHSLIWSGKMMRQASPQMKANILGTDEVQALRSLTPMVFARGTHGRAYLHELVTSGRFIFFKMPYLEGLHSLNGVVKGQSDPLELFEILSKPSILRSLGQIIAVDMFIGNCDRFDPQTGNVLNPGNVVFQKLGEGTHTVVGLDFYENSGPTSNLARDPGPQWGGNNLRTEYTRQLFADKVVVSLNKMFSRASGGAVEFSQGHAWQIRVGMEQGIEAMQAYMNRRLLMRKQVSPGIMNRARMLGWF